MARVPPTWDRPGPIPPGDRGCPDLRPGPGETLDYLSGHWKIFQLRRGHRYSTDDLLTAWWAVRARNRPPDEPGTHLDLGCGIGSVGLLVAWACPGLRLVGVEAQEVSAALARRTVRYDGVEGRVEVRVGDFRDPIVLGPEERFDLVTGSPPYLAPGEGRRSPRPQRGPCRFEERGGVGDYLRVASAHLAPGGVVVWVHASRYREENLAAARSAGLAAVGCREVVFREGRPSLIALFHGRREAPAGDGEPPGPLLIRRADGTRSPEFAAIRREMGFPS